MVAIGAPARRIAEAVQLEHDVVGQAQLGQDARAERDHLDVGERLGSTQDLDVDLMELAQPPSAVARSGTSGRSRTAGSAVAARAIRR